jgi:Kdo2-lipid IVA lauroyltransferase/acyltransferase
MEKSHIASYADRLIYRVISALFSTIGLISAKRAARMADIIGKIWFSLDGKHRGVALENLTQAYGGKKSRREIRILARRVFGHLVLAIFEICRSFRMGEDDFLRQVRITGIKHLTTARAKGRGVLLLSAHIGNWEFLNFVIRILGFPMTAIYRPLENPPADRVLLAFRSRFGANLYPKYNAMRKILRSLSRGELVGILLDQDAHNEDGVFVDFFGRPACTNKGLALVARGTQAPVIPVFIFREEKTFHMDIQPEVPLQRTRDKQADILVNTRAFNRIIEAAILRHPEQWFWVHRRWKTRPRERKVIAI